MTKVVNIIEIGVGNFFIALITLVCGGIVWVVASSLTKHQLEWGVGVAVLISLLPLFFSIRKEKVPLHVVWLGITYAATYVAAYVVIHFLPELGERGGFMKFLFLSVMALPACVSAAKVADVAAGKNWWTRLGHNLLAIPFVGWTLVVPVFIIITKRITVFASPEAEESED